VKGPETQNRVTDVSPVLLAPGAAILPPKRVRKAEQHRDATPKATSLYEAAKDVKRRKSRILSIGSAKTQGRIRQVVAGQRVGRASSRARGTLTPRVMVRENCLADTSRFPLSQ
jgi:hypothetical protein